MKNKEKILVYIIYNSGINSQLYSELMTKSNYDNRSVRDPYIKKNILPTFEYFLDFKIAKSKLLKKLIYEKKKWDDKIEKLKNLEELTQTFR